jgi:hypothetical protein
MSQSLLDGTSSFEQLKQTDKYADIWPQVQKSVTAVSPILQHVSRTFPEYTLHNLSTLRAFLLTWADHST